jgi:hypothetical protein
MGEDREAGALVWDTASAQRFWVNLFIDLSYYVECRDKNCSLRQAFRSLRKTIDCRTKPLKAFDC